MGLVRAIAVIVIIAVVTMLTLNIDIFKETAAKDPISLELFRTRRAIGRKPTMVFGKCGGNSYGRTGWLASPNFPGSSYPALSSCNWTITVYPRMVIKFDFVYMDMEDAPKQKKGDCQSDYLMIREGPKEGDPLVGGQRYCGFDTPFNSVYSTGNRVYVYFASDHSTEGQGFAVRWSASDPPTPQFNCDFESVNGLCTGWQQDTNDQFDWSTHYGLTQSGKTTSTGPLNDHTKGDETGTYAFTEASGRRKGDKAILSTPPIRIRNPDGQCFRFWYNMRGDTMGTLNVYKKNVIRDQNTTAELIFTKSGNQGKPWRRVDINVTATITGRVKFMFEGVRGSSYKSDMAIDDIILLKRPCPAPPATTTTTTTTTTTRRVRTTRRPRRTKPTTTTIRTTTRPTTTTPFTTTTSNCPGEYKCKERGNCIPLDWFCDGVPDCVLGEDEKKCSGAGATTTTAAPVATWSAWTDWTICTATCGGGRKERTRSCSSDKSLFECIGSSLEGMECNTQKCLQWNPWEEWSACTQTCGGGVQTRGRTCDGGKSGQPGCIGPLIEVNYCNEHNCPEMGEWGQWSQCSVTCGNGTKVRLRTCEGGVFGDAGCDGSDEDRSQCVKPACAAWTDWVDSEPCSVTCGEGRVTRTRKCQKDGKASQECQGSPTETKKCDIPRCPVMKWADWEDWSPCTATCGGGFHGRRRSCKLNGKVVSGCKGRAIESGSCNKFPCPVDPCVNNPCENSGSCVTILAKDGKPDYVCACPPGYKGKNCSTASTRTCHTGVSLRYAAVPIGSPMLPTSCVDPGDACMVATVGAFVEGKAAYVDTAQCARASICKALTCDDLKKTMPDYDVSTCKIHCCDDDLCNTAPLDLPPPPTTTRATTTTRKPRTRKPRTTKSPRRSRKPTRKPRRTTPAATIKPPRRTTTAKPEPTTTVDKSGPHWSDWQSWQGCTHLCGNDGLRRRFRFCMKGAPGMPGCMPANGMTGEEPCNRGVSCIRWRDWAEWQSCSRSCGGGTQERRRSCEGGAPNTGDCIGSDVEKQKCNEQSCDAPTTTSTTSTTLSTTKSTTKKTTSPPTTKPKPKGARWGDWSDWDQCSVSCGLGTQTRRRKCIGGRRGRRGCRGSVRQTQDCNNGDCVTTTSSTTTTTTTVSTTAKLQRGWTKWSDWEACSVSCGLGTSTRSRECNGGRPGRRPCRGKRIQRKQCDSPCPTTAATTEATPVVQCMERNLRLARKNGRRCTFECFADSNCDDGLKCVCDGLCGRTCQDTSRRCINVLAGDMEGTNVQCSDGVSVGSKCTFSCDRGYQLRGKPDIFCQGTTKWTNQKKLPKCIATTRDPTTTATTASSTTPSAPTCRRRTKAQDSCCGPAPYNSSRSRCCNGKVNKAGPAMTECCGTVAYDPRKKGCCGSKTFKTSNQKCENGAVVRK